VHYSTVHSKCQITNYINNLIQCDNYMIMYGILTEKETSHQNRVNSEQQTSPAMITTSLKLNARLSGPVQQCGHCWVDKKMQLNFMFASRIKLYEQKLVFQVIWYLLTSHDLLILMAYVCKSFSLVFHIIYLCFTCVLLIFFIFLYYTSILSFIPTFYFYFIKI